MNFNIDKSKLGKVNGYFIGNYSIDYIFVYEKNKNNVIQKLNKIENTNYTDKDVFFYKGKFITKDLKFFTSKPDELGYSYWVKIENEEV